MVASIIRLCVITVACIVLIQDGIFVSALHNHTICQETKCRGNLAEKWNDACWTADITDPSNCADEYKAIPVNGVDDAGNEKLTYFTCCQNSEEEEIIVEERECDSAACTSGNVNGNGKCLILAGEEEWNVEGSFDNACNNDDDSSLFKYPNIVMNEATHILYNCCKTNDGSVDEYRKEMKESRRCDASACSDLEQNGNCAVSPGYNAFPEPFTCCHEHFRYPNLVNRGGSRKWDWYGGWTMYNCCEMDDGSLSSLSETGFLRNRDFYFTIIPQLVISIVTATLLSVLTVSILASSETRSESYNLYIIFLAIPDWFQNAFVIVTYSMILMDDNPYDVLGDYFVVSYLIFVSCFIANIWINTVIAYEMHKLVTRSNRRMRTNPPSKKRVLIQCLSIYSSTLILDFVIYTSIMDLQNSTASFVAIGIIFIMIMVIPCGYLIYAGCQIWKTGLLSLTGRTRSLTIYFGHIILVFFVFMIPYFGITIIAAILAGKGINIVWSPGVGLYLLTLQGAITAAFSMTKGDILKSVVTLRRRSIFKMNDFGSVIFGGHKSTSIFLRHSSISGLHDDGNDPNLLSTDFAESLSPSINKDYLNSDEELQASTQSFHYTHKLSTGLAESTNEDHDEELQASEETPQQEAQNRQSDSSDIVKNDHNSDSHQLSTNLTESNQSKDKIDEELQLLEEAPPQEAQNRQSSISSIDKNDDNNDSHILSTDLTESNQSTDKNVLSSDEELQLSEEAQQDTESNRRTDRKLLTADEGLQLSEKAPQEAQKTLRKETVKESYTKMEETIKKEYVVQ